LDGRGGGGRPEELRGVVGEEDVVGYLAGWVDAELKGRGVIGSGRTRMAKVVGAPGELISGEELRRDTTSLEGE
jgi:hypothetical protein